MSPRLHTVLTQCSLRVRGGSYLCQTYATLRGGVISSKTCCLHATSRAMPASEAWCQDIRGSGEHSTPAVILASQFCTSQNAWVLLFPRLCVSYIIRYCSVLLHYHGINSILSHRRAMTCSNSIEGFNNKNSKWNCLSKFQQVQQQSFNNLCYLGISL